MDSDMQVDRVRQFRIKTGVLQRAYKEKLSYEKEAEQEKLRLTKMKNENLDKYTIQQQEAVLNETLMIIPDCQKRLNNAYNELKTLLMESNDLNETEQYTAAQTLLNNINIA